MFYFWFSFPFRRVGEVVERALVVLNFHLGLSHDTFTPHSQVLYQKCFISKHCNYTNLGLSALWVKFLNLGVSLLSVFQHYSQRGLLLCFAEIPRCFLRRLWRGNHAPGTGIPNTAGAATALVPQQYNLNVPTLILCLLCFPPFLFDMFASLESLKLKNEGSFGLFKIQTKAGYKIGVLGICCHCKARLFRGAFLFPWPCFVCGVFSSRNTQIWWFWLKPLHTFSFVPRLAWRFFMV